MRAKNNTSSKISIYSSNSVGICIINQRNSAAKWRCTKIGIKKHLIKNVHISISNLEEEGGDKDEQYVK